MWMPRVSGAYKLGERTVVKGGYGLFFDTLNAGDYAGFNQFGYSSTTTNVSSTDFGQTWLLGDPVNGILAAGRIRSRCASAAAGSSSRSRFARRRLHPRHELHARGSQSQAPARAALADWRAAGSAARHWPSRSPTPARTRTASAGTSTRSTCRSSTTARVTNVRDATQQSLLQQQVPNPFNISNFASLATTNPALYARMAGNAFFTAANVQRQTLLRGYPQLTGLVYANLPLGVVKNHALEITVDRRYAAGLSANLAFAARRVTENRTVEAYDREPTLWQTSQNARPWRLSGSAVYELPFGKSKPFLNGGGVAAKIVRRMADRRARSNTSPARCSTGATCSSTATSSNIAKDNPEIALQRDGTIDLTKTWFNIDAGFERDATRQPAAFQKRSFPFRIDGVRGTPMFLVNANIVRNFALGGRRQLQVRMDVQNLFDAVQWGNPNLDPTSTNFGRITTATNSIMRFFTFVGKVQLLDGSPADFVTPDPLTPSLAGDPLPRCRLR